MILDHDEKENYKLYRNLERECALTADDRRTNAQRQKSTFLTGTENGGLALYNRLKEWARWSTGNLYTPDVKWDVTIPLHYASDKESGALYLAWCEAAREDFARFWRESGAALVYGLAVRYAHIWDGAILKVVANDNAPTLMMLGNPGDLGVLREGVPSLDRQEAICHYFDVDLPAFDRLIAGLPDARRSALKVSAAQSAAPTRAGGDALPNAVSNIIVSGASPSPLTSGAVTTLPYVSAALPREQEPVVRMAELWVRDDEQRCWRKALLLRDTSEVLYDPLMKRTYGENHAFHLLALDEVPEYLWGWSPMDELVGLQMWREKRMADIDYAEQRRLNPAHFITGVSGDLSEVQERLRAVGGVVGSSLPGADIKPLAPQPLAEPFALVKEVDTMFDRQSGQTRSGAGEGQPNVRSGEQEFALGAMAAPRMIEQATRVESVASDIGTQMFRMRGKTETLTLRTADGQEFSLDQLNELSPEARVLPRSASPVYTAQLLTRAVMAHKAGAIDDEDLIDFLDLPRASALKAKARKRNEAKAKAAEEQAALEKTEVDAKATKAKADAMRAAKA